MNRFNTTEGFGQRKNLNQTLKELYGPNHERNTFVYCDDDNDFRNLAQELLSIIFEKEVLSFPSATEALYFLSLETKKEVAMVISDFNMPITNGLQFAHKLRQSPDFSKTPFLLTSGDSFLGSDPAVYASLENGELDAFLLKTSLVRSIELAAIKAIQRRIFKIRQNLRRQAFPNL